MSEITLYKIEKIFSYEKILKDVNFDIHRGERVGLIGRNGTGKTTIFKIITGEEHPSGDIGKVIIRKGAVICSLDQIPLFQDVVTVEEILKEPFKDLLEIAEELRKQEIDLSNYIGDELEKKLEDYNKFQDRFDSSGGYNIDEKIRWICAGLKIPFHHLIRSFNSLSGGEKTRVVLASLLLKEPDVLLLDEPTNHLDMESVEWLEEFLRRYTGAALIISHDRYFLDRVINKILVLTNGKIQKFNSNYTNYALEMKNRQKQASNEYDLVKKEIRKVEADLRKSIARNAKNHSAFMSGKIRSLTAELDDLKNVHKPKSDRIMGLNFKVTDKTSKIVLRMDNVCKSYGKNHVLKDINLLITKHEKVAIIGENGSGKSTLIKLMIQHLFPGEGHDQDSGDIYVGNGIKAGYLDQELAFLNEDLTILEYLMEANDFREGKARTELARFLFYTDDIDKKIRILSGGEKTRLKLCSLIQSEINTLILDEPTNHLDIDSRELLESIVKEFPGNVVYISHDRYFINKTAEKIFYLNNGKITVFKGNYEQFKDSINPKEKKKIKDKIEEKNFRMEKKLKNKLQKLKRQKADLEMKIEDLEKKKEQYDVQMLDYPLNYEELCRIQKEKEHIQITIDKLFLLWEEMENQNWSV